jgi:hypothetical protein
MHNRFQDTGSICKKNSSDRPGTTLELNSHMEDFHGTSLPQTSFNSGHRFYGMELEHTKRFLGLSRPFTAIPTVTLLVAIVGVTPPLPHAKKNV